MDAEYQNLDDSFCLSAFGDPEMKGYKPYDLEERIVNFAVEITKIVDALPENKVCTHLGNQLLSSGTSPALNYGEAQAAESINDFAHKFSICLKELRETKNRLTILKLRKYIVPPQLIEQTIDENEQLVKIFRASIKTAQMRKK